MSHRIAVALVLVVLSAVAEAGPRLKMPCSAHFEKRAVVDSVDISFGRLALGFASWFIDKDDPEGAEVRKMLKSIKSVSVCSYTFDSDFAYSMKDLDAVREQLSGKGWSPLVQVRDRRKNEDVDVFLSLDGEKITGIAIVASQPREFTIVNVVGKLDLDQVERWASQVESRKGHRWGHHNTFEQGDTAALKDEGPAEDLVDAGSPEL